MRLKSKRSGSPELVRWSAKLKTTQERAGNSSRALFYGACLRQTEIVPASGFHPIDQSTMD